MKVNGKSGRFFGNLQSAMSICPKSFRIVPDSIASHVSTSSGRGYILKCI